MSIVQDDRDLEELLRKLELLERGTAVRELAANIAEEAIELVKQGFEDERDPYGNAWAPLTCRDGQILRDTGVMLQSLHVEEATETQVTIAMGVWYSVVHQTGKVIVPRQAKALRFMVRGKPVFAQRVEIPARPFFPREGELPDSWRRAFDEVANEWFAEFFGRR